MRELRTCDFCAADAVGTFEIVPPELEPTEAEQRRVVCCPDCRDRLETLLEPLLARLGAGEGDRDTAGADQPDSDAVVTTADDVTATRSRPATSNATVTDVATDDTAAADSTGSDADGDASESDPAADESEPTGDDPATDASSLADGITLERDEQSDDTLDETADDTATEPSADASNEPIPSATPPRAYSKVVRLLRNREFPMERSAVEDLAAGAYDLESDEIAAIVDYAIEDGEFVENRGKLRRP